MKDISSRLLEIMQAVADPVRLALLQHLMAGPAPVAELVAVIGTTQPNMSNHLALLRARRLVRAVRAGRQMIYEIADPAVAQLVESLSAVVRSPAAATRKSPALIEARTCYDHLAGKLGVALFDALVQRRAIQNVSGKRGRKVRSGLGLVRLGPAAQQVFAGLRIDLDSACKEKRRFATACLDWTEERPHLGGALGAAVWSRFVERGWVIRKPGTRAVILTPAGRKAVNKLGVYG